MLTVLLGLVVGFGALRLLLLAAPDLYRSPALARTNNRGRAVATGGGLLVVLAVVLVGMNGPPVTPERASSEV